MLKDCQTRKVEEEVPVVVVQRMKEKKSIALGGYW